MLPVTPEPNGRGWDRGPGGKEEYEVFLVKRSSTDLSKCRDASPGTVKVRELCSVFPQLIAGPEKDFAALYSYWQVLYYK